MTAWCRSNLLKDLPHPTGHEALRHPHASDDEQSPSEIRHYTLSDGMGVAWW